MSVKLCLDLQTLDQVEILGAFGVLIEHNVRLYRRGLVRRNPLGIRWNPDDPASESVLRDVYLLVQAGEGSCGELACAYAGWFRFNGSPARVELISTGSCARPGERPESCSLWHAVAVVGAETWDPQVIGA